MATMSDPEQICEDVLRAAGHSGPPTNLKAVSSLWSDLEVIEEDLDQAGYLVSLGVLGADILIRSNDPPARKGFTLAHELGHWTLANLEAGRILFDTETRSHLPPKPQHKRQTPEETWCNKFAACLLMPKGDLNYYLKDPRQPGLPERIWSGHSVFQVSQEAFLSRISEMTSINIFEVVATNSSARIRRKFLSRCTNREEVERLMAERLEDSSRDLGSLGRLEVVDNYQFQSKITRQSPYGRTIVVSVVPGEP